MERTEMASEHRPWRRQREDFWRAHHEAWKLSELNQREYCEAHGLPQKGFENWRQKFKAEPQPPERKLLHRRGGLSHRLSHTLGHSLSHTPNHAAPRPIVPAPREGRRRAFSDDDKRRIVEEATQPGAVLSAVARRYGIAARIVFRWKQELSATPRFVTVEIVDDGATRGWESAS
jgi:hypothetical protein